MARKIKGILIVGGSGFVGSSLALYLRQGYKVYATYFSHPVQIPGVTYLPGPIREKDAFKRLLYSFQPDVTVYAAGSTNLDWIEENERLAEEVHAEGPATLSTITDLVQSRFVYLSNGYPFDGTRGNYHETDTVLPDSAMGKIKLAGENFIRQRCFNHLIVRSSPLFGRGNGRTFSQLDRWRIALDRGRRIEVADTEFHSFAPVQGLCEVVGKLVDGGFRNKTFHFGGLSRITDYDLARRFARTFGYDEKLVGQKQRKDSAAQAATKAPGGGLGSGMLSALPPGMKDYSLNTTNTVQTLKIKPALIDDALESFRKKMLG